jgi:uncharacterized protein (TIGR02996 family)
MTRPPRPDLLDLLEVCKDNPDDADSRLVLADWLEEHGDEHDAARAELIRLRLSWPAPQADRAALRGYLARERALLEKHRDAWLGPIPAVLGSDGQYDGHNGLVRVRVPQKALLSDKAGELAKSEAWAWVETVTLDGFEQDAVTDLFDSPLLRSIAELRFNGFSLSLSSAQSFAASEQLGRLRSLSLYAVNLSGAGMHALVRADFLPGLTRLWLGQNPLGDEGVRLLARCGSLTELRALDLSGVSFGTAGAEALATANLPRLEELRFYSSRLNSKTVCALLSGPGFPALRELSLGWCSVEPAGMELLGAARLGQLRNLDLVSAGVGNKGAAALAASPHLRELRKLRLADNRIGARGAAALAQSACVGKLVDLDLGGNPIGPSGARALARSEQLANLEELDLARCGIGPAGAAELARSPHLARLRRLELENNKVGPEGASALTGSPFLTCLESLYLQANDLGDEGVAALASSVSLASVRHLWLSRNDVGDAGAAALGASPHLGNLRELYLTWGRIGAAGVGALAESPGLAGLEEVGLDNNPLGDKGAAAMLASTWRNLSYLGLLETGISPKAQAKLRKRFGEEVTLMDDDES